MIRRLLGARKGRQSTGASGPPGERLYAIGDIHGRLDLLDELLALIATDGVGRGDALVRLIFLGDLVDRGPDSAGVVARVRALMARDPNVRMIKGNHEEVFINAAHGDARHARALIEIGGMPTLTSYGITEEQANHGTFDDLAALIERTVPSADVDFLAAGEELIQLGDYVFVHAGIRPGVPLDQQKSADLRWIRGDFLASRDHHGVIVVHGHTIFDAVDMQHNRIGIDTGAFATGKLTALAIEGSDRWIIETPAR